MKAIAVFGRKGGSGKTLVSHFLSHGMSLLDYTTIMLQTDVRTTRPAEILDGRSYMLASTRGDGTDPTLIQKVVDHAGAIPNSVLVMDGGANRRNLDLALAPLADIILVPTGYSPEDLSVAEADYWELSERLAQEGSKAEVFIIMNRWPGLAKKMQQINAKQWVKEFMSRSQKQGNLFPFYVPDMPSLLDMANGDSPKYTLLIDSRAKGFANLVAKKLGMIGEGWTEEDVRSAGDHGIVEEEDDREAYAGEHTRTPAPAYAVR